MRRPAAAALPGGEQGFLSMGDPPDPELPSSQWCPWSDRAPLALAAQGILRAWAEEYSELAPVADAKHVRVFAARVQNICHHTVNNRS